MKKNYEKIDIIDGLDVCLVPVSDITEKWHTHEGEELDEYYTNSVLNSVKKCGILTPIVLFYIENSNKLHICDGWHRWKIAQILKIEKVPAIIFNSLEESWDRFWVSKLEQRLQPRQTEIK